MLSTVALQKYAQDLTSYLKGSKPSYLDIVFDEHATTSVFMTARFDVASPCYDLVTGTSVEEKTLCVVQNLISPLSLKYIPWLQDVTLESPVPKEHAEFVTASQFKGGVHVQLPGRGPPNWKIITVAIKGSLSGQYSCRAPKYSDDNLIMDMVFKTATGDKIGLGEAQEAWRRAFTSIPEKDRALVEIDKAMVDNSAELENRIKGTA